MLLAREITKSYHHRKILDRISFALPAGHCLGISGENGSGKSTLLSILAQVNRPDSGDILYNGRSVLGDRAFLRQRLGYVPQHCDLFPDLTAQQQLRLWQSACGCREPLPADVAQMLCFRELEKVKISEMSGGMRQRVSIALALCANPEILIMDEATAGLDAHFRESLLTWLEEYMKKGGRLLWCSHLEEENSRLCGTILPLSSKY